MHLASSVPAHGGYWPMPRLRRDHAMLMAAFAGYVLFWTIVNTVANGGAVDHDMTEAYVWGREFQLGYYKHPPFWAWIAGAWFSILPHRAWAFALLSSTNAAIGLLGSWFLIGRFASGENRISATLLLLLTPYYSWFAYRFNANTIFLSLWPWTALFFVRSVENQRRSDAVLFGIFAGFGMLSKYYAVVLLATCGLAGCVHPNRRAYFTSVRPWISFAAGAALFLPHLWWLIRNEFPPFHYFAGETGHSWGFALGQVLNLLIESAVWLIPAALVIMLARRRPGSDEDNSAANPRLPFLAVLCFAPVLLTVAAGLTFRIVLTSGTAISTFCLAPLLLIEITATGRARPIARLARATVIATGAASLALSPLLAYAHVVRPVAMLRSIPGADQPGRELAEAATRIWHDKTSAPLRIVGGTISAPGIPTPFGDPYADLIAFYSSDQPSEFIDYSLAHAPWITRPRLARDGLLTVCPAANPDCVEAAMAAVGPHSSRVTVTLSRRFLFWSGRPATFILMINPPHSTT